MSVSSNTNNVDIDDDDATLEGEDLQDKSKNRHFGNGTENVEGIAKGETPVSAFFGFLSALGLISAGLLFQSAHEEQLNLMMYYLSDASTYVNWVMAFAFFTCTFILMLTQVGKKQIGGGDAGATNKTYNRVRTRVDSEDHGRHLNRNDIEMSGFLEADD